VRFIACSVRAMLRLLSIFAQHLSILSNQLVVRRENDQSTNMTRARIEDIKRSAVARADRPSGYISRHYFCKMFKKATGIIHRLPLESSSGESKTLLLNPNSRISEVAFACGFQSMTNFNREFKRIVRRSPRNFANRFEAATLGIELFVGEKGRAVPRGVTRRSRRWAIPVRLDPVGVLTRKAWWMCCWSWV